MNAPEPRDSEPIEVLLRPFAEFARLEASGGILLIGCTLAAMAWANSPWSATYQALWHTPLTVGFAGQQLSQPLHFWINDGLMAVFFFVVGLEIKREVLVGELASLRQATLPIAGALGGMVVPAAIYLAINAGHQDSVAGWGIPMATDIAFAIGVMALLGSRVPLAAKVFLTALAIVDDIGAVLVIAVFYTADLSWIGLAVAGALLAAMILMNLVGARHPLVYAVLGIGLWMACLASGVHATLAGVLAAMTIPARPRIDPQKFLARSRDLLETFDEADDEEVTILTSETQQSVVHTLEKACEQVETPMQRFEHTLLPWVTYVIVPVFALANAGVDLRADMGAAVAAPASLGIVAGLLLGKPLGIFVFSWIAVRLRVAHLPPSVTWRHILGTGILGGIGFTMSLFIGGLAFGSSLQLEQAKVAILAASVIAGAAGWLVLRASGPQDQDHDAGS